MTVTLQQCEDMILHTLDADSLPVELEVIDIVNRAGSWLYTAHPWSWLRRSGTLGTTSGQNYINLASSALPNVTKIVEAWFAYSVASMIRPVSLAEVVERRAGLVSNLPSYCAVGTREISGALVRTVEFDVEFASTVTASSTGPIFLVYEAGWVQPGVNILVPVEFEGIFLQVLRAYARGYQEEDIAPLDQRLGALSNSMEFKQLKAHDAMRQVRRGPMRGGGVEMQMRGAGDIPFPKTLGGY